MTKTKRNIIAIGNTMNSETNTIHQVKGERCGNILRTEESRLEQSLWHRIYECDHCHSRWKFVGTEKAI